MEIGVYIHVPFCMQKCRYCDFYSVVLERELVDKYLAAVDLEFEKWKRIFTEDRIKVASIYIGGGTPTILPIEGLSNLLSKVKSLPLKQDAEITCEANPATVSDEKFKLLKSKGVNRLSFGAQAWQPNLLRKLGRNHLPEDILETVVAARKAGFVNLSLDLMYGLPGQTLRDWEESLNITLSLGVPHLSLYALKVEEGTPFYHLWKDGKLKFPEEDETAQMYWLGCQKLKAPGYLHYEISNFAKKGYECRHNLGYWKNGEYIGVGPGAFSCRKQKRWMNIADILQYWKFLRQGESIVSTEEDIDRETAITEKIILNLRLAQGLDTKDFYYEFQIDIAEILKEKIDCLRQEGYMDVEGNRIFLTEKGFILANQILVQILAEVDYYLDKKNRQ